MKIIFIYIVFLKYIKLSLTIVPVWDFESKSIKLSLPFEYTVNSGNIYGEQNSNFQYEQFKINRTIYKDNGIVKYKQTLYLNGVNFGTTIYNDIESAYKNSKGTYFICPKGKYHVHYYNKNGNSNDNGEITISYLKDKNNWDLKCYYQLWEKELFIAYLNSKNDFFQYNFEEQNLRQNLPIHEGLYAYRWKTEPRDGPEKQMFAIINDGQKFYLRDLRITVRSNENAGWSEIFDTQRFLVDLKSKSLAFIRSNDPGFYFINYNNDNDFESGFYNSDLTIDNIGNIKINIIKDNTPFKFLDDISINETNFIYDTRYVYYKIYNNNKQNYYHGIIDISLNTIIFNTDKEIQTFIPYNNNSMLAITKSSAYRICGITNQTSNEDCINECDNNNYPILIDSTQYNVCGGKCENGKYILKPENVCIDECDETIHIKKGNECWLCKDYDKETKFKLININKSGCLKDMPKNSKFINEKLSLIACNEEFTLLENGNCVKNCSNGNFLDNQICEKCDTSCQTCDQFNKNCTSCIDGEYLDTTSSIYSCNKCSDKCEKCSNGKDNCLTCKQNTTFQYLYNNNCLEKCPDNTTENGYICIPKDNKDENKKDENKKDENKKNENESESKDIRKNDTTMLWIFIIISGILLLIIIICFCKNICFNTNKTDSNLINEINTELIESKELF